MLNNLVVAISGAAGRLGSAFSRAIVANGGKVISGDVSEKKGNVQLSIRCSTKAKKDGFNLAKILNKVNLTFKGSTGGHVGAAGMKGMGDGEALLEMVKQECVKKIKEG